MFPKMKTQVPGPKSQELARRLKAVESPNITFASVRFPIFWKRAFGSNVEDVDGNIFIDLTSAFGVTALGHTPSSVTEAVIAQLKDLPHGMGDVHPTQVKVEL